MIICRYLKRKTTKKWAASVVVKRGKTIKGKKNEEYLTTCSTVACTRGHGIWGASGYRTTKYGRERNRITIHTTVEYMYSYMLVWEPNNCACFASGVLQSGWYYIRDRGAQVSATSSPSQFRRHGSTIFPVFFCFFISIDKGIYSR